MYINLYKSVNVNDHFMFLKALFHVGQNIACAHPIFPLLSYVNVLPTVMRVTRKILKSFITF